MMTAAHSVVVAVALLCLSAASGQDARPNAWSRAFSPPAELDTERMHLEPLHPRHAELDHKAFMSSREHLRKTLHWGDWPADDATVADNREDLQRHWSEFEKREAYAYTVLTPDRKRCIGCVYMRPGKNDPRAADLAYWVVAAEVSTALDEHFVEAMLGWIERDWPLDTVVLPLHTDNARGIKIAEKLGLRRSGPPSGKRVRFVWQREARSSRPAAGEE